LTVAEWEELYEEGERDGWQALHSELYKGIIHEDRVTFAYQYGKVDDGAVAWLFGTHVAKVTPEIIVVEGMVTPIGALITQYTFECVPSRAAKF
jgi:hypothetical protein